MKKKMKKKNVSIRWGSRNAMSNIPFESIGILLYFSLIHLYSVNVNRKLKVKQILDNNWTGEKKKNKKISTEKMANSWGTNDKTGVNNAISNLSLNNTRKPIYQSPLVRRKQLRKDQILSQIQQYQKSDSSVAGTSMPRCQSVVKPTWQNVCPGEVPHETLDRLNQLSNGEQMTILFNKQQVIFEMDIQIKVNFKVNFHLYFIRILYSQRLTTDLIVQNAIKHPSISRQPPATNKIHIIKTMDAGPDNEFSCYDGKVCVLFAIIFWIISIFLINWKAISAIFEISHEAMKVVGPWWMAQCSGARSTLCALT